MSAWIGKKKKMCENMTTVSKGDKNFYKKTTTFKGDKKLKNKIVPKKP